MDPLFYTPKKKDQGVQGLGLFEVRVPAPAAPGSSSSEDAADAMDASGRTKRENDRVLTWFAAQSEPRTRHECAETLYPESGGLGSACGRINTLVTVGLLAEVGRRGRRATLEITAAGRAKFARIHEAAA